MVFGEIDPLTRLGGLTMVFLSMSSVAGPLLSPAAAVGIGGGTPVAMLVALVLCVCSTLPSCLNIMLAVKSYPAAGEYKTT